MLNNYYKRLKVLDASKAISKLMIFHINSIDLIYE
jgi:hypothetical protein